MSATPFPRAVVECPFCDRIGVGDLYASSEHAAAFADAFPLNPGHTLVVPLVHEPDLYSLASATVDGVWRLVGGSCNRSARWRRHGRTT